MTKILYCKDWPYINIPENVIEHYRASKSITERFIPFNRADQDLIHCIEEYIDLHPEDERAKHIGIADIGNATRYIVFAHHGWEAIYTEDTLPWKVVGVSDNDCDLVLQIEDKA